MSIKMENWEKFYIKTMKFGKIYFDIPMIRLEGNGGIFLLIELLAVNPVTSVNRVALKKLNKISDIDLFTIEYTQYGLFIFDTIGREYELRVIKHK